MQQQETYSALERLVAQLTGSGWRDRHGHPIERNAAFLEARALVDLRRAISRERRPSEL